MPPRLPMSQPSGQGTPQTRELATRKACGQPSGPAAAQPGQLGQCMVPGLLALAVQPKEITAKC